MTFDEIQRLIDVLSSRAEVAVFSGEATRTEATEPESAPEADTDAAATE